MFRFGIRSVLSISFLLAFGSILSLFAASSGGGLIVDHFEIILPESARVGEAIDVTVRAMSKGKNIVTNYNGTITFNVSTKATYPARDGYVFQAVDNGVKTFSKGLIFQFAGTSTVTVYDSTNDIIRGTKTIKVEPALTSTGVTTSGTISITSPENNAILTTGDVTVIGNTRKNSKVKIILNGVDVNVIQSDNSGSFTTTLKNVVQKSSAVKAQLLDASNVVVATSPIINFQINNSLPSFYGLSFKEGNSVEAGSTLHSTLDATAGLEEASILIDGVVNKLITNPIQSGKYEGMIVAPNKPGTYPIDVTLKTVIGQERVQTGVLTLTVNPKSKPKAEIDPPLIWTGGTSGTTFQNVRVVTSGNRATFTFEVVNPPDSLSKFKIKFGDTPTTLTQEATTYTLDRIFSGGSYTWYIPNLAPKKWYFIINGADIDGQSITGVRSDLIMADLVKSTCTIANVSGLSIEDARNKVILSWSPVAESLGYNVYRKSPDGTYAFIAKVESPTYTVNLAPGSVTYADFGIKALCSDGKGESPDYTEATNVQTGPESTIFLIFLASFVALFVSRKRLFLGISKV